MKSYIAHVIKMADPPRYHQPVYIDLLFMACLRRFTPRRDDLFIDLDLRCIEDRADIGCLWYIGGRSGWWAECINRFAFSNK